MADINAAFVVFNGGEIGAESIDRVTLENYAATSETLQDVWVDANGPMCLRPGFGFELDLGETQTRIHPFIRSIDEKFLIAFADEEIRVLYDGGVIARPAVTSTISNGSFTSSLTGWTDISAGAATASVVSNRLALNSDGSDVAGVRQLVTTSSGNTLHALEITVAHGPVTFKCGSSSGGDEYISERDLKTGFHSIGFTPTGSYYIEFTSSYYRQIEVDSVIVASDGDMVLPSPWTTDMHQDLRAEQSLNTLYVFHGDVKQRRIERWDNNSWSLVETNEENGPFKIPNVDESLTITPSVRVGNGSLFSSRNLFKPTHVGGLWKLVHAGQFESRTVTAENQWSDPVLVQGVGGTRAVTFTVDAGLTATVRIQQSIGNTESWVNAATSSTTSGDVTIAATGSSASQAYNDGLDNNSVYYRVGVDTGDYTSGSATVTIYHQSSTTEGIVRVTNYTSATQVSMEVIENLSMASATSDWYEGEWSDKEGWPRAGTVFDGRLWTLRQDQFWGSYSEAYESHDYDEGASSAIARSVAVGGANEGQWMIGLGRLIIGTEGAEVVVRSNAFDEPLSTTNMTVREMSTYGVGNVQPVKVDTRALYVDASTRHLMEVVYNVQLQDYVARPLTTLHRDIGSPGIKQLAVMRRPDTRVFALRTDGTILIKLFDPGENVMGWSRWTSTGASGVVHSIAVLPSNTTNQDEVWAVIKRTVDGTTSYYLEKLGPVFYTSSTTHRVPDSYIVYDGVATTTITGLDHLEGETVQVWADGYLADDKTVSSGQITLDTAASVVVAGLATEARYKSSKLAFGAEKGTALGQRGRPEKISFIMRDCYPGGLQYSGTSFDDAAMDQLNDRTASDNYDTAPALVTKTFDPKTVPGRINQDSRIYIKLTQPGWVQGFVCGQTLKERVQ